MLNPIKKYLERRKKKGIYLTLDAILNFNTLGSSERVQQLKALDNTIHTWLEEAQISYAEKKRG